MAAARLSRKRPAGIPHGMVSAVSSLSGAAAPAASVWRQSAIALL